MKRAKVPAPLESGFELPPIVELDEAARDLAGALERYIDAKIRFATNGAQWIEQSTSPLGRRKHLRLAREGVFASARKVGRAWFVLKKEIDAYIAQGLRPDDDEIDQRKAG